MLWLAANKIVTPTDMMRNVVPQETCMYINIATTLDLLHVLNQE
jgi:hypothetical protein